MRELGGLWLSWEGVSAEGPEGSLSFWLCDTPAITTKESFGDYHWTWAVENIGRSSHLVPAA